jgi:hypothetical protein
MANGEWRMADGEWRMADGEWRMADGEWRMADGESKTPSSPFALSTSQRAAPPANWSRLPSRSRVMQPSRILRASGSPQTGVASW